MPAYWTVGISNGNGKLIINAVANSEAHFLLLITESCCKMTEIQQKRTGRDLVHEISTGLDVYKRQHLHTLNHLVDDGIVVLHLFGCSVGDDLL